MIAKTAAKATKQCEREEGTREERRCERLKGQCELSKLAVLLGDAKRGRREMKRKEMESDGETVALGRVWCRKMLGLLRQESAPSATESKSDIMQRGKMTSQKIIVTPQYTYLLGKNATTKSSI